MMIDRIAIRRRVKNLARPAAPAYLGTPLAPEAGRVAAAHPAHAALAALRGDALCILPGLDAVAPLAAPAIDPFIQAGEGGWSWPRQGDVLESQEIVDQQPAVYLLGLEAALLDLTEAYLGAPCYYCGCYVKRETVRPDQRGTRQWHVDVDDLRMLRMLVYFNAVGEGGGAFEYLSCADTRTAARAMDYRSGFIGDGPMLAAMGRERWQRVLGPAGTVIFFDGSRLFHRAGAPTRAPRLSLTFTYTTRHPRQIFQTSRLTRRSRRRMLEGLSDRAQACIPGARIF